jgi:subtilisin family serine protease
MNFGKIITLFLFTLFLFACGHKSDSKNRKDDGLAPPKEPIIESITPEELSDVVLLNWHHYDLEKNKLFGISSQKAYDSLKLKQAKQIVVAVIDSGVDFKHEDLIDVMWTNPKEIPGNGIDDDGNGYVDDIHGWNFVGGSDGKNLVHETLEVTRIYRKLLDRLQEGESLSHSDHLLFIEAQSHVERELQKYSKLLISANKDRAIRDKGISILCTRLRICNISNNDILKSIKTEELDLLKLISDLLKVWDDYRGGFFLGIERTVKLATNYIEFSYNIDYEGRKEIVGDNPNDFSDLDYGNNDVKGPNSNHGTHVAGIIAATRNNGIGINGIAANVKIMALRAVPNGDERDKDIVHAVRYAVDNGAKIINMSFGKLYSPEKDKVDAAFDYAAENGVLIIHSAGNDSQLIDGGKKHFPNSYKIGSGVFKADVIKNWIEVGASTKHYGAELVAKFSNFGKDSVTLFSPGHKIYSSVANSKYASYSGTSMASPVVAGVAAMLMSEFPEMSSGDVRNVLIKSVNSQIDLMVQKPGKDSHIPEFYERVFFKELSQSSGVINAFEAIVMANRLGYN